MPIEVGPKTVEHWKRALAARHRKPGERRMPREDEGAYTPTQKRRARTIAKGSRKRRTPRRTAKGRAPATVNKRSGGGRTKRRGRRTRTSSARKAGRG